jgi:hypothetical protein
MAWLELGKFGLGSHWSHTITDIIEDVRLIDPASPHANHVLVSIDQQLKPITIHFLCHPEGTAAPMMNPSVHLSMQRARLDTKRVRRSMKFEEHALRQETIRRNPIRTW